MVRGWVAAMMFVNEQECLPSILLHFCLTQH